MTPLAAPFLSFTDDAAGRLVSADLTVGVGATARGSCTAATAAGFDKAYRCTMTRGDSLEVSVTADANTTGAAIGWTAGTGVTVSAGVSRPAVQTSSPDGAVSLWQRTRTAAIGCTATGTATITVTLPDAADYTARISIACEAPSAIVISGLGDAQARGDATVSVPGSFEVSPGTASCTASALPGSASTGGEGNSRTVTAAVASGTSATVTVTCSQAPLPAGTATALFTAAPADGCNTPLGVLPEGVTTASGTVAADAACTTAHRYRTASRRTYYARRHTFSLDAAASVTIDLADADTDAESLDTYLVLLARGDAGAVARLDADDDSGAAAGDSRLADSGLAAGGYTIVATSFGPGRTGAYTLSVDVAYDAEVQIAGLDSTARVGDVDVTDTFTVTPAAATCTAESSVGTATVAPLTGATRTVTLPMTAPASATVTVACRAADHADGIARAIFAVTEPAEVASVTLTSGGACTAAPGGLPDGIDQAFGCTLDEGDPVTVNVTAVANHAAIAMGWATSGNDVVATPATVPAATSRPDGDWQTTAAADLSCTADGTATLTVTAGSGTDTDIRPHPAHGDVPDPGEHRGPRRRHRARQRHRCGGRHVHRRSRHGAMLCFAGGHRHRGHRHPPGTAHPHRQPARRHVVDGHRHLQRLLQHRRGRDGAVHRGRSHRGGFGHRSPAAGHAPPAPGDLPNGIDASVRLRGGPQRHPPP